MAESLISRIGRGAALLDKKRRSKACRKKIDLDKLNISHNCDCIGGQLYGGYHKAPDWFIDSTSFLPDKDENWDVEAKALTRAWKRYLA